MNLKEREQSKVFSQVKAGTITQTEASKKLGFSYRWTGRKYSRYLEKDDFGLVHRGRGKKSSNRWNHQEVTLLIELLRTDWYGFGPTFAAEKLEELHGIKVSKETVRKAMIEAGLWHAKIKKIKHRQRRERKPMLGIMVQLDGSPHDWFEGRAGRCTLLVFIDDATSKILWLEFVESESTEALMRATKNYIEACGIPQSFYTDHGCAFHVNLNNKEGDKKTQWERACEELGIEVIHAHSPQAKGRVERCNKTMQDRLVKDMRLAGISSIEEANRFLRTSDFIRKHNMQRAEKPTQAGDAHKNHEAYDLNGIFTIKDTRVLTNDFTITFNKRIFQLQAQQKTIIRPKNNITIKVHLNGTIKLWIRKTELSFCELANRPVKPAIEKKVSQNLPRKPSLASMAFNGGHPSRVKPATPAAKAL